MGKSSVNLKEIGEGAIAGPVEMYYISNTNNKSDSGTIRKVLETCAAKINQNNGVNVEPLTKDPNQRLGAVKSLFPLSSRIS